MAEKKNYEAKASDKVKQIVVAIKEKTAMTTYELTIIENSQPDIFDSKFGGVPYWDMTKEYPKDSQGNKMMLLAQINFTKAVLEDERLPKQGILQFFIASEDDVYGMDFNEPDSQENFRIVFHENIDMTVTKEQVQALEIPVATDEDNEYTPVFKEAAVEFHKTTAYMGPEDISFEEVFRQTVKEQTGEDIGDLGYHKYLYANDRHYLYDELAGTGHRIFGYPFFTQYDPRDGETAKYYDTLLFQMDSDMKEGQDYVLWGDCGVANFFINSEMLKKKDFSKVMYNWDCC
ncbi:MAG: DUF1963 domain-containing protein [Lachnospiraceae bacterium]|nr:DUF1963 domain-containing protein [Lachnospiraceae bacterium]